MRSPEVGIDMERAMTTGYSRMVLRFCSMVHTPRGPSKEELPVDYDINVIADCCADADEEVQSAGTADDILE